MISLVSAKGPSVTMILPPDRRTFAPSELGARPPVLTSTPALAISSEKPAMAAINLGSGGTPASDSFVALAINMNFIVRSLLRTRCPFIILHLNWMQTNQPWPSTFPDRQSSGFPVVRFAGHGSMHAATDDSRAQTPPQFSLHCPR